MRYHSRVIDNLPMETKTVLLLRHAKSSWKDPQLDDHDRPLNARGREAATRVGQLLYNDKIDIDLVLCSASKRARETADFVFAPAKITPPILFRDDLYHASPTAMVEVLNGVAEPNSCVILIGHNPGMEEFLALLTGRAVPFPTAALARIELDLEAWSLFDDRSPGRLTQFWRPRDRDAD